MHFSLGTSEEHCAWSYSWCIACIQAHVSMYFNSFPGILISFQQCLVTHCTSAPDKSRQLKRTVLWCFHRAKWLANTYLPRKTTFSGEAAVNKITRNTRPVSVAINLSVSKLVRTLGRKKNPKKATTADTLHTPFSHTKPSTLFLGNLLATHMQFQLNCWSKKKTFF